MRLVGALALCLVCWFAAASAAPASAPLPPRRPAIFGFSEAPQYPALDDAGACLARLDALRVDYEPLPPQEDGDCRVASPVRLYGVEAGGYGRDFISFRQRPLVDCSLAARLADWLREAVSPLFKAGLGAPLKAISTSEGYVCRTRNRDPAAKLSAHGLGLALDIAAFELADGRRVRVGEAEDGAAEYALDVIRKSTCGWFTTVLGPSSPDHLHENHLHVDIQPHGSAAAYRICE